MLQSRKGSERGLADHGWLRSFHTFSFAGYYDPAHMGFGSLRVINEDRVAPGKGFGTHGHQNMEIISYVLDGALEHKDSMGNGSVMRPGDVQRMSAGTGVRHSEFNPSPSEFVHFLQIWILPDVEGIAPSYQQKHFPPAQLRGNLRLLVSPDGRDGSLSLHQNAFVYASLLDGPDTLQHPLGDGRRAYVHLARGSATVNGERLLAGDALAVSGETGVSVQAGDQAEVLLFDLAAD
jgi:redox-sensitive bicupin YhaK (pirin superfamily)